MAKNFKVGVAAFCKWARDKYGEREAEKYIRQDITEEEADMAARMKRRYPKVWKEFMVHYVTGRVIDGK